MLGKRVMIGNPIAGVELSKDQCVERSTIVADQYPWDTKPAEHVLHLEALHLFLGYGCQGFSLDPLG